jgi:hypothetical protein
MAVEPEAEKGLGIQGTVLKQLVFLPFVQYPPLPRVPDLSDPAYADPRAPELANSSNFYISSPPGDKSLKVHVSLVLFGIFEIKTT